MLAAWLAELDGPAVLVTVADFQGTASGEPGARMLVEARGQQGTIGGGELEWQALKHARTLLREGRRAPALHAFSLGPELGERHSGFVRLLFEPLLDLDDVRSMAETLDALNRPAILTRNLRSGRRGLVWDDGHAGHVDAETFRAWLREPGPRIEAIEAGDEPIVVERLPAARPQVWLFGAGRVGRALVDVLGRLPTQRVIWIDERPGIFPGTMPDGVAKVSPRTPELLVPRIAGGAALLVMTHSSARDLAIVGAALARRDFSFVGLMGSRTKRARFERQLRDAGLDDEALARLVCPIGLPGIRGREPEVLAVAVAAQLLAQRGAQAGSG